MEQKKKYSFYEGGDVENKIAGKYVADPLGVLMVLTPKLWEAYSDGVNNYDNEKLLTAADKYYREDAAINDENIKVRSLKRVRVWMDAVIAAFIYFETNISDPAQRGLAEVKVLGDAAGPLGTIAAYSSSLWHDTCKAIATEIGKPFQEPVDTYYAKDKAIKDPNAKIKGLKRIRVWLDLIIQAVEYIEERTEPLF